MKHGMKGLLSFIILWLLKKGSKTGAEIALELERRKGKKPSPGTIYPALKDLKDKGLIIDDKDKKYSLTKKGEEILEKHLKTFFATFCDLDEMRDCCG
jgi:DNA-binding PadR family transcriptional regulator